MRLRAAHLAATSGATPRELMDRMGALIQPGRADLLHRSAERQQMIADAISEQAHKHLPRGHVPDIEGPAQENHRHVTGIVLKDEPQARVGPARLSLL